MADEDEVTTEQEILTSLGESDESATGDGTDEEGTGTTEVTTTETVDARSGEGTAGGNEGKPGARPVAGPQDLVDKQGNILAKGGTERRHYENLQKEKAGNVQLRRELDTTTTKLAALESANTVGTQYGLTPEESVTGAQLIAAYKKDPVETIQYMLTQAQASGHNIEGLGGGHTDMSAIKQMITEAVGPLVGDHQQKQQQQERHSQAVEQYNQFTGKYPDVVVHEDVVARLLQDDPSLSPEAAYFKLRSYYSEKGLDWTKNLATLQTEMQTASRTNTQVESSQPPEGGGVPARNVTAGPAVADVNTSTSDIVRQAMSEAGIQ